jgi:hypothetical protein
MILIVRLLENLFYRELAGLAEGGRPGREGSAGVPFRAITGAATRTWWAVRPVGRRQDGGIGQWDSPVGSTVHGASIRPDRAVKPTQHRPIITDFRHVWAGQTAMAMMWQAIRRKRLSAGLRVAVKDLAFPCAAGDPGN